MSLKKMSIAKEKNIVINEKKYENKHMPLLACAANLQTHAKWRVMCLFELCLIFLYFYSKKRE